MRARSFNFLLKHNNKLLNYLYFFYNIYIRNFKYLKKSSQFEEDMFIKKYFKDKSKGKFVDLGCFHPTRDNNTYQLYKRKWTGINIDLNSLSIDLFNFFRSRDINLNIALANKKGVNKLFYSGQFSPLNSMDSNHLNFLKKNFNLEKKSFKIKNIKTESLNNILEKHNFFDIDLLSIDLEGYEYEVLRNFKFNNYKIDLICIEMISHNLSSKKNYQKLSRILRKNNFKFIYKTEVNFFYKNKK